MHKELQKKIDQFFGAEDRLPDNLQKFIDSINNLIEGLEERIRLTEDVTENNIRDLIISNIELNSYLKASRDIIFRVNADNIIVDYIANQDYPGIKFIDYINRPVWDLPLCDDPKFFYNALEQVRNLKLNLSLEYPLSLNSQELYVSVRFLSIIENEAIMVISDIISEKNAIKSLVLSEKRLDDILKSSSDIIYTLDGNGIITYVNPGFQEMTGHNENEVIGRRFSDFLDPETVEKFNDRYNTGFGKNEKGCYVLKIQFDNGDTVPCEINISTLYDDNGDSIGLLGVARDMRSRNELSDALEESHLMYRILAENITDVIWTSDLSFTINYISPSIQKVLGYTPAEVASMPKDKIFTRESIEQFSAVLKKELERERRGTADPDRAVTLEAKQITKKGSIIDIEIKVRFLRDDKGRACGLLGLTRNISERKKTELALQRSREKYRDILENMRDGYFEVDLKGTYTYANEAACRIFGCEKRDITGMSYKEHYRGGQARRMFKLFNDIYTTESPVDLELFKLKKSNGELQYLEASANLIFDEKGSKSGFCGILRDVTERIKIDESLRLSEETLRKRNAAIEKDLKTAQLIIKSIFTEEIPEYGNLKIDYRYFPLDALGGDYFLFRELDGGALSLFLGDVASHGVTAALFISLIKAMIERVYRNDAMEPDTFIEKLNGELYGHMPLSFLTAVYGIFTTSENGYGYNFTFSSSGHPSPVVFRNETREVDFNTCKGTLMGMIKDITAGIKKIQLNKGDRLFLYTDGLPETMNRRKELWGYDRLLELFKMSMKNDLGDSLDSIINELKHFKGDVPFEDDIVLLGFEVV